MNFPPQQQLRQEHPANRSCTSRTTEQWARNVRMYILTYAPKKHATQKPHEEFFVFFLFAVAAANLDLGLR